jgi:choline-sulfatase
VPITENGFLHVNYWDAHTPYRAPAEFGNPFKDEPLPAWLTPEVLEQHQDTIGPHGARQLNMYDNKTNPRYPRYLGELKTMEDLHAFIDGYDCGIRYMDTHIGLIMQALKEQGVYDDLAVIISSDHGENLGELGIYGEHGTADGITPHIPMIIKW